MSGPDSTGPGSTLSWVDLRFLGQPHAIATAVIRGAGEVVLIDPGPTPCLPHLEVGLRTLGLELADVTHVLLTHIHLDHAASTGTIVRRYPRVRVFVHTRGAPHMAEPSRLLASAARLYGARMQDLWGDVEPVPAANLVVLDGTERLAIAGRRVEVAYTPGHASHHVSYFDSADGTAYVGDTAGVQIDGAYLLAPTPPPDIDLIAWKASIAAIMRWEPAGLFLTHFGPTALDPQSHMDLFARHLEEAGARVRAMLEEPGTDAGRSDRFGREIESACRQAGTDQTVASYRAAAPFELLWPGLARYWRRRAGEGAGGAPPPGGGPP
jgi:glyoxylase-like metal-dependent hydrolase (beta-lactamase superfamily II)